VQELEQNTNRQEMKACFVDDNSAFNMAMGMKLIAIYFLIEQIDHVLSHPKKYS